MLNTKSLRIGMATLLVATSLATATHAADYLTGYAGGFDMIDQENESAQFGAEYRFSPVQYGIRPTVGMNFTGDGAVYGYGGFNWDVSLLPNQLYLVPNFMVGAFSQGSGKDLGHAIEFRSGIEVDYQFANAHRVGIAFNHISNAGIGDKNPGAETLLINYSIPMGRAFGN